MICWENAKSYLLLNPSYSKSDQKRFYGILEAAHAWPGHIWLSTSGSSVQKWVGLSKQALLISARAVNQHLKSDKEDRWVNALPSFHVGGLSIWARAHLSRAQVFDFREESSGKWRAEEFYRYTDEVQGTLSALVPTQLHDLVGLKKRAPSSLRALIIGGGGVLPDLYERAIALGWPVLPSYGLTECASQVATAPLGSWLDGQEPVLQLLPHMQACARGELLSLAPSKRGDSTERLSFAGPSLLSTYAFLDGDAVQFTDPKNQGWLTSEDRGLIQNERLFILGRVDAIVKVGGENVDLARLENLLQTLRLKMSIESEVTLVAMPDERLSKRIVCVSTCTNQEKIAPLIEEFQRTVLPFERIQDLFCVPHIPRSSLGKILRNELIELFLKRSER